MCGVGETEFDGLFCLDRCARFYVIYVVTCEPHDASSEDSDGGLLKCVFCIVVCMGCTLVFSFLELDNTVRKLEIKARKVFFHSCWAKYCEGLFIRAKYMAFSAVWE